jgi:hypothetical protein
MMVKVTPMPISVIVLVCKARLRMLRMVKKFLAVIEKNVNSTITAAKVKNLSRARPDFPGFSMVSRGSFSICSDVISLIAALPFGLIFGQTYVCLLQATTQHPLRS